MNEYISSNKEELNLGPGLLEIIYKGLWLDVLSGEDLIIIIWN